MFRTVGRSNGTTNRYALMKTECALHADVMAANTTGEKANKIKLTETCVFIVSKEGFHKVESVCLSRQRIPLASM